jgi:enterochelin esterase-like enzyme
MNSLDPEAYSCFRLATALAAHGGEALRIKFDCGLQDYLLEVNRKLHARLDELGLPHDYAEYPGVHDGSYWQPRFADLLAYIDDVFGIEAKSK